MPQIGPLEILVVGVLALLVFGPEKLPEMARSVGKGLAQMKSMASEMKSEFDLKDDEATHPGPKIEASQVIEDGDSKTASEPPLSTTSA